MKRRALITGSSSGIGEEYAKVFAREGYDLILVALGKEELERTALELESKYNTSVFIIEKDLTENKAVEEVYEEIKKHRLQVDFLVNNAGFGDYSMFFECKWEKQQKMIELNITALVHLTRLFLPEMIERGFGKILNMASNAAFQPGPGMSIYFASKAFVLSFSEALSNETKGTGVTVTSICPGSTKTPFNKIASDGSIKEKREDKRPDPREVAEFGYKMMMKGKSVAIHGFKNSFIIFMLRFLPRTFVTEQARKIQKRKFSE